MLNAARGAFLIAVFAACPALAQSTSATDPYIGTWHQPPGKSCDTWKQGEPWEATFKLVSRSASGFYEGTYLWGECMGRRGGAFAADGTSTIHIDQQGNLILTFATSPASSVYTLHRQGEQLVGTLVNAHGVSMTMNMRKE